jgi:hypothetical protein
VTLVFFFYEREEGLLAVDGTRKQDSLSTDEYVKSRSLHTVEIKILGI